MSEILSHSPDRNHDFKILSDQHTAAYFARCPHHFY